MCPIHPPTRHFGRSSIVFLFPVPLRDCPPIGKGLACSLSMRANVLPIGDSPVFMIGADRCAEGPFGDWVLVPGATDWQIGDGLARIDWYRIDVG